MGVNVYLCESIIVFRICTVFINPACFTLGCHNRNLVGAVGSGDDMGSATDDVFTFKCLHQGVFVFIRYKVATFRVSAFRKHVADRCILGAHAIPERLLVGIGCTALLLFHLCVFRLGSDGSVYRHGHFPLHCIHLFLTFDFLAKVYDLGFHLFIGPGIFIGKNTGFTSVGIQEVLGSFPCLGTHCAKFVYIHKSSFLHLFQKTESLIELFDSCALHLFNRLDRRALVGLRLLAKLGFKLVHEACFR